MTGSARLIGAVTTLLFTYSITFCEDADTKKINVLVDNVEWFDNAAFRIFDGSKNIYVDVYTAVEGPKADIICFTHSHDDHFSALAVKDIVDDKTIVISPIPCQTTFLKEYTSNLKTLAPGESIDIDGITIKAVYAYTLRKPWHPRNANFLGYVFTINGVTVYHTGDTERIPEMKDIKCDIIMLPLGQIKTMNSVEEAAECVLDVKAKIAIPMHWGIFEGTKEDVKKFQQILNDKVTVMIKTPK